MVTVFVSIVFQNCISILVVVIKKLIFPLSEMCPWIFLYHELRNFIFMLITLS